MVFGEVSHIPICAANKFYRRSYSFLLNIPICAANKFYRRLFYNLNTGILLWIRICRPFDPRGSGSQSISKDLYKSRPIVITKRDKNINDEVPGNGLLLTASDAFNWKECLINKFVKWGCVSILDTYPAEASQLKKEFVERLKTESTPKKALQNQEEKEKIPVAQPVDRLGRVNWAGHRSAFFAPASADFAFLGVLSVSSFFLNSWLSWLASTE